MKYIKNTICSALLLLGVAVAPLANAHLMVAQHGTLNFLGDDVFMVLSIPISAFKGIDGDNDGKVTMIEFNNHRDVISKIVKENVELTDNNNRLKINGLMLSPVVHHNWSSKPITQLTLMGKFKLLITDKNPMVLNQLKFHVNLFGTSKKEQVLEMKATNKAGNQKHIFELTPKMNTAMIFE